MSPATLQNAVLWHFFHRFSGGEGRHYVKRIVKSLSNEDEQGKRSEEHNFNTTSNRQMCSSVRFYQDKKNRTEPELMLIV